MMIFKEGHKIQCIKSITGDKLLDLYKIFTIEKVKLTSIIYSNGETGGIIKFEDFPLYFKLLEDEII